MMWLIALLIAQILPLGGIGGGHLPSVDMPVASPVSGTTGASAITLTDGTSGASICYTTDGSTPTAATPGTCDGLTYSSPVSITPPATVKAIGTKAGGLANSSVLTASYPLPTLTEWLTVSGDVSTVRHDFSGWLGSEVTVGGSDINVVSIGRYCVAGNSDVHNIAIYNLTDSASVVSTTVDMAGCAAGTIVYVTVSATLTAGKVYALHSQETNGGDYWVEQRGYTTTGVASGSACYGSSVSACNAIGNTAYVPTNFQYE